jgi:5-formyltetrahydrofolate cyclo-ligase
MEDAVVLGAVFRQTRDIDAALREYETQRCERMVSHMPLIIRSPVSSRSSWYQASVSCISLPWVGFNHRAQRLNGHLRGTR